MGNTSNTPTYDVPIMLMLFNRLDTTREVFARVRQARPKRLFVAANGPRPGVPSDVAACAAVRDFIMKSVDWDCDLQTDFPETNVDMQARWWKTLDWFFDSVDRGIILEDDCVPDMSFFPYCAELLEKYKDDERIMHINGSNFQFGIQRGATAEGRAASYYFSEYAHVWGWATWRRAWRRFDPRISSFPAFAANGKFESIMASAREAKYWRTYLEKIRVGILNSTDIKWIYTIWANDALCITPNKNLISNIGFGLGAGHTFFKEKTMGQKTFDIGKLEHPQTSRIAPDIQADLFTFKTYFYRSFMQKAVYVAGRKVLRLLRVGQAGQVSTSSK